MFIGCSLENELDVLYSAGIQLEQKAKLNEEHHIIPKTIKKSIRDSIKAIQTENIGVEYKFEKEEDIKETINKLTDEMLKFAGEMEFEKAVELRDKIKELEKLL